MIAHHALPARFDRYIFTAGYNTIINRRQFGFADLNWPTEYRYPDRTYHDRLDLSVGGLDFVLRHEKGETDDHTVTWQPDTRVLCCGDLFIWASPNAGNPQKVQRYPREWADALRRMLQLDAEFLLPGHGFPVMGADRVRQALTDTADLLDSLVDQTLAVMNAGGRLDDAIHAVRVPAALEARPYLRPVYDEPEFIVHTVWRQYGGWWDGNPATLKPAPERALATELAALAGGPRVLADRALELLADAVGAPEPASEAAEGALRLAGHLAEQAWLAEPADEGSSGRASRSSPPGRPGPPPPWRGACSPGPPTSRPRPRTPTRTDPTGAEKAHAGISNFFAGFDSVGPVDSSLTSPPAGAPESPARGAKSPRRRLAAVVVALGALLLTGCQLPTFGAYKGATSQGRSTFHLWQGFFIAGVIVGGFILLLIMWAIFRYRRRSDDMPVQTQYHTLTEITYTVVPILIVLGLFWATVVVENTVTAVEPNPGAVIHVYAFQWGWEFEYPNGVKVIGQTTDAPTMVRADGADDAHLPALLRRAARLLRARVQLQPLRQPRLLDQLRPQRPAQRRVPGPVHPAVRALPLHHVLQRALRLPDGLRDLAADRARLPDRPPLVHRPAPGHPARQPERHGAQLLWQLRQWQHRQHRRCALR